VQWASHLEMKPEVAVANSKVILEFSIVQVPKPNRQNRQRYKLSQRPSAVSKGTGPHLQLDELSQLTDRPRVPSQPIMDDSLDDAGTQARRRHFGRLHAAVLLVTVTRLTVTGHV
jgi:hypothetical protein